MKCIVCLKQGSHFKNKICPEDTKAGYTKSDVTFHKSKKVFVGEASSEAAHNFVEQLRSNPTNQPLSIKKKFIVDRDRPENNKAIITYCSRTFAGGSNG